MGPALQVITRVASTRVAEYAFKYATDNKRQKVTALHKANIMKKADGLFIECCREVAGGLRVHVLLCAGNACGKVAMRHSQGPNVNAGTR